MSNELAQGLAEAMQRGVKYWEGEPYQRNYIGVYEQMELIGLDNSDRELSLKNESDAKKYNRKVYGE